MYTRKQYMKGEVDHQTYYAQFGQHLVDLVKQVIGEKRVKASEDEHFNDIDLKRWDRMHQSVLMLVGRRLGEANGTGGVSLSDTVCSAKAAARIIRGW